MSLRERLAHLPESHLHTSTPEEQILGIAQPYDSSQVLKMTKPETRGRGVTIYGAIGGWRKESGRQTYVHKNQLIHESRLYLSHFCK